MTKNKPHDVNEWLGTLDEKQRRAADDVINLVLAADPQLDQSVKWGRLTFAIDADWHNWICGIAVSTRGTRLVFHKGALINDPNGLLSGSGRYVREIPAETVQHNVDAVTALVRDAVGHRADL